MTDPKLTAKRRERALTLMKERGIDHFLVTNLTNVRYLTGFSGSNAVLLLSQDKTLVATDGRYTTQIGKEAPEVTARIERNCLKALRDEVDGEVAIEGSVTVSDAKALEPYTIVNGLVEELRLIKDQAEIDALQKAADVADKAWLSLLEDGVIAEGVPEITVAAELEYRMRKFGSDGVSFDTIVASGTNGAKPHHSASTDTIPAGLITIDFGVWVDGYASDQTRMVSVGEPEGEAKTILETVKKAFDAGCAAVKPGAKLQQIDKVCRDIIDEAGYGEYFVHSTGHGVGLDVHEQPGCSHATDPEKTVEPGMTLTIEPGIYVPGLTGARIENTLVITDDGAYALNKSNTQVHIVEK